MGNEIYNLGRSFLGHQYNIFSLSDICPGAMKIFTEIHQFYTFPEIIYLWGGESWNLQIHVSLPYICYKPNLVNVCPVLIKKILTRRRLHDRRRRTPTHSNRSPEWLANSLNFFSKYDCFTEVLFTLKISGFIHRYKNIKQITFMNLIT